MSEKEQIRWVVSPTVGADPELFLTKGGEVIGSEKVLPSEGLPGNNQFSNGKVVLDGVQVELHPSPSHCRQTFSGGIAAAMQALKRHLLDLEAKGEKIEALFDSTVHLSKAELDTLSERSRELLCQPSENAYGEPHIDCKGKVIRTRSAGGHIHLGTDLINFNGPDTKVPFENDPASARYYPKAWFIERVSAKIADKKELGIRLSKMLDVFLGIPSVLIDRDEGAAERRKLYGRAGEHRLPEHGVEYRTLSNFWLRHYVLTSFVMAQARFAANVLATGTCRKLDYGEEYSTIRPLESWDAEGEILKLVDLDEVRQAINTNDLDLAWKVWGSIRTFIANHQQSSSSAGLNLGNLERFERFARTVQKKGLPFYFPDDPITHWADPKWSYASPGWEAWIASQKA